MRRGSHRTQTIRARHLPDLEAELDVTLPPPSLLEQLLPGPGARRWLAVAVGACILVAALAFFRLSGRRRKAFGQSGRTEW